MNLGRSRASCSFALRLLIQCRHIRLIGGAGGFGRSSNRVTHSRRGRGLCFVVIISILAAVGIISSGTSIICFNWTSQNAIEQLCRHFRSGELSGDLCGELCHHRLKPTSCSRPVDPHLGKEVAFSAAHEKDGERKEVFVKSKYEDVGLFQRYPYQLSVSGDGRSTLHVAIADILFYNFAIRVGADFKPSDLMRAKDTVGTTLATEGLEERDTLSLWLLAQQKEYLLFKIYDGVQLFPTVVGSCGHFYVTEHLIPLTSFLKASWEERLTIVQDILRLLERAQVSFPVVLRICDVKLEHFGVRHVSGSRFGSVRLLDGDEVYFQSVLDDFQRHRNGCRCDSDCSFFDCQARCDVDRGICDSGSVNNNLQSVCEKMLVRRPTLHRLFEPGLLHSPPVRVSGRIDELASVCRYNGRSSDFYALLRRIKQVLMID